jgi:hypothetical protein
MASTVESLAACTFLPSIKEEESASLDTSTDDRW